VFYFWRVNTLSQWKRLYTEELGDLYSAREMPQLLGYVLEQVNFSRMDLVMRPDVVPQKADQDILRQTLERLKEGEPVQYVLGKAHFRGISFGVNEHVLIPRPETEELVEWVLNESDVHSSKNVLDVGTGSGCIAISLALEAMNWKIYANDVSQNALLVASQNARNLNAKPIHFFQWDALDDPSVDFPETLDIIVSNPPYVPRNESEQMHERVKDYEPDIALFVPSEDPLLFYKRLAQLGKTKLGYRGELYLEIHEDLSNEVTALLHTFEYSEIKCRKDLQNKNRMIKAIC
jgi:release factor glutamine methyltransferase